MGQAEGGFPPRVLGEGAVLLGASSVSSLTLYLLCSGTGREFLFNTRSGAWRWL